MDQSAPFYIGLCMAGAISAGAYTAGVMDYLIEALDDWESKRGQPGVPGHRVKIPVIGGASAGGMTGIITASAINNPITPVTALDPADLFAPQPQNKFYHSWVDLTADDMFPRLLDTADIKDGRIVSLLNSAFIDDIAARAIQVDAAQWKQRAFFENNLKLFTTLSSLRGLSFNINFRGSGPAPDNYFIIRHNDYACFELNTPEYHGGGWIPLDFRTGLSAPLAKDAAMATGAFPVGLRSRKLSRSTGYVNDNVWLRPITAINPVVGPEFETLNVDGGLINNEPFEKVRNVLTTLTGQDNPADYNHYSRFTSTVLMIDPFPSTLPAYNAKDDLFSVMGGTLNALIDQVRVKPETLVDAMNSDLAGQYLITPSRKVPQLDGGLAEEKGERAIACGSFGGFGGFLHKEFRIHDYFLGRANCEKFLRDHFTVPATSDNLITAGYASLSEEEKQSFYSQAETGRNLPIIPVLTPRKPGKYMPVFSSGSDWPVRHEKDIEQYRGKIKARVDALIMNLADYGALTRMLIKIGGWVVLNRKLAGVALGRIKDSLHEHQLLRR